MLFKKLVIALLATVTLFTSSALAEKISTYLVGAYEDAASVQTALKGAGFEILAEHQIDQAGDLTSVVFTCPTLKAGASKDDKGFASVLSYPTLSMSQFMTIATVPGAIENDCKKAFK